MQASIANVGQPISTSKNSTINYEIDKTIRHVGQHPLYAVDVASGQVR